MAKLPPRERHIVRLYYFGDATMKQIGAAIGVNESRVSQLHARAIQRLRTLMAAGDSGDAPAPKARIKRARLPMTPDRLPQRRVTAVLTQRRGVMPATRVA
jgi:hypothetical protein